MSTDPNNIYVYYQNFATGHPINIEYYAAGLCKQSISGYSDWYLPAICEMGYQVTIANPCGSSSNPTLQNMQSNLVNFNNLNLLLNNYWSSTEDSSTPQTAAWTQVFDPVAPLSYVTQKFAPLVFVVFDFWSFSYLRYNFRCKLVVA